MRIDVVVKCVTALELSQMLMECPFTHLQLQGRQVLAVMRDGAAVNGAALAHLRPFMPMMIDIVCFSPTFDNVGLRFDTPILDDVRQHWVRLFSVSYKAKLEWKDLTGKAIRSFSDTRWWSRWEM